MIDLNLTIIFQLFLVLILMVALSQIVFKPFMRVSEERRNWVERAEKKARELQQRTEEMMQRYRDAMASAQAEGTSIREEIRKKATATETETLQKAMSEANRILENMKAKIREEAQQARVALRLDSQTLSREIAEKILGRAIQ